VHMEVSACDSKSAALIVMAGARLLGLVIAGMRVVVDEYDG
jgi:hypothetical protein